MTESESELGEALGLFAKIMNRGNLLLDGVIKVVGDDFTCDIDISGTVFSGVPIDTLIGSQPDVYFKPKVNSKCLMWFRDSDINRPQLLKCQEIDTVIFYKGTLGGMVKLDDVVSRLNNIEDKYNDLVSKFNAHTHILTLTSGTGTAAPTVSPETPTDKTTKQELENTKILQ